MNVTLAENAGFCFGVKRALELAEGTIGRAYTLGPLIHNPQVVEKLNQKGIKTIETIDEIKEGIVIIRSHGVPKSTINKADEKCLSIVDATCPFVKKAQDTAIKLEEEGYQVIIIGEPEHPEIKGIAGNLQNPIIIDNVEEAEQVPGSEKLAVVAQTTLSQKKLNDVTEVLSLKTPKLKVENTICSATEERQNSALELANAVDLMVVIGGKNSGNTKRLKDICENIVTTYLIETKAELDPKWFESTKTVGVTAGASTPDWIIQEVVEAIKNGF